MLQPRELIPLTDSDKEWLMTIYKSRIKNLYYGFLIFTALFTFVAFTRLGFIIAAFINDLLLGGRETWLVDQQFLSGWYIKIGIAALIALFICIISFFYGALPYKKDAVTGMKQLAPFLVTKKVYNAYYEQCLIWLKGSNKSFQVNIEKFNNCQEGEMIVMEQAVKSKYIFSLNDSYNIYD